MVLKGYEGTVNVSSGLGWCRSPGASSPGTGGTGTKERDLCGSERRTRQREGRFGKGSAKEDQ